MKIMNLKCKDLKNASFDMSLKSMYFVIKSMINWLQLLGVPNLVCKNVLLEIKAWLARQWEVQTIHVFREANRAALSSRSGYNRPRCSYPDSTTRGVPPYALGGQRQCAKAENRYERL